MNPTRRLSSEEKAAGVLPRTSTVPSEGSR